MRIRHLFLLMVLISMSTSLRISEDENEIARIFQQLELVAAKTTTSSPKLLMQQSTRQQKQTNSTLDRITGVVEQLAATANFIYSILAVGLSATITISIGSSVFIVIKFNGRFKRLNDRVNERFDIMNERYQIVAKTADIMLDMFQKPAATCNIEKETV